MAYYVLICKLMPNTLNRMNLMELLTASPWPLTVTDIASTLEIDEVTRQNGPGWIIV